MSGRLFRVAFAILACVLCSSCVGLKADIEIRANGSGTIALEYRVSRMVESMGKLDGNERYLPLPVGKNDFERTVTKVPGLSLKSWSQKEGTDDIVVKADLAFANPSALTSFLDASGRTAHYSGTSGAKKLSLRLSDGSGQLDKDLEKLVNTVFTGYSLELTVKTPTVPVSSAPGTVGAGSRTASFTSPMATILTSRDPISWDITWKD